MAAKLEDVIERLKTEGYLNRFKSKYSMKNLQKDLEESTANLRAQSIILQEMLELQKEQSKDAERQNKLLFGRQSNSAPTVPKPQASSSGTSSGGGRLSGGLGLGVGIAAVGAGLAGFIAAITGVGSLSFTGENLPEQAKNIALGMNEFAKMDNRAVAMIGGLLAGGVILSKFSGITGLVKAPIGMAAVGLGLGGFMAGLAAASEGMDFVGLDLDAFPEQAGNLVAGMNELSGLNDKALIIMGSMIGAGVLLSQFKGGVGGVTKAAVGMTAVGLGIGGFMAGVAAAGDLTGFTGENFATQTKNMVAGIKELESLSEASVAGLVLLAGAGAIVGGKNPLTVGFAASGMGLAGFGIGAFITGIMAPSAIAGELGGDMSNWDGSTFASQMGNLATGFKHFEGLNDSTKAGLAILAGAGAIVGGKNPLTVGFAASGMGLAGFGLGAFVAGFFAAGDVAKALGADGSGFATMMENITRGIEKAGSIDIPEDNFAGYKEAMKNLSSGLTSFAVESLKKNLADAGSAILKFFGFGNAEAGDPIRQVVNSLEGVNTDELAKSAFALNNVATALDRIGKVNLGDVGVNFEKFAKSLLGTTPLLHLLYYGGEYGAGWFDGLKEVSLDKKYSLQALMKDGTLGNLKEGSQAMGEILRSLNMGMSPNLYVTPGADTSEQVSRGRTSGRVDSPGAMGGQVDASTTVYNDGKSFNVGGASTFNYNLLQDGGPQKSLRATVP